MKNRIVSMKIVRRHKIFNLHDVLSRVYNSIFYYLRAVAYKVYNSIVRTRWRVSGTQYTVYSFNFEYCCTQCTTVYSITYQPSCTNCTTVLYVRGGVYTVYSFNYEHLCTHCTTFDNGVTTVYSVFA